MGTDVTTPYKGKAMLLAGVREDISFLLFGRWLCPGRRAASSWHAQAARQIGDVARVAEPQPRRNDYSATGVYYWRSNYSGKWFLIG
jgi:hypothetical protein